MSLVDLGKQLLEASKLGKTEEVRVLMSNGAPFTTDWLGSSPLHFAVQFGRMETVEVLLRAGISRDARTKVDRTPLHIAAQEGHLLIVELLLTNGADIEARDMLRMTPLHWAVEKGHVDVTQLLLNRGATVNAENKFDKTPMDIAISNGRADIVSLLQMSGNLVEMTSEDNVVVEEVTTTEASIAVSGITQHDGASVTKVDARHSVPITISPANAIIKTEVEETVEANSTAVLATLAALAEATSTSAPSATHTEALSWLETHGITMISSGDEASLVASTLQGGQTLVLTEAGKLALKIAKQEESIEDGDAVLDQSKIVTIVTGSDQFIPPGSATILKLEPDPTNVDDGVLEKTVALSVSAEEEEEDTEQVDLRRQLKEAQRQANEYRLQLQRKELEAEVYMKQLSQISKMS